MKSVSFLVSVFVLLPSVLFAQRTSNKLTSPPATLEARIKDAISGFQGNAWIYAKNLDTGKDFALRADEQTRTASTIKLAIMAEAFHQVAQGKVKWTDEITLTKEKKQGGTGVLSEFSDGTKLDLQSALHLMIVVSDNT